jgi:hypothetical protein
MISPTDLLHPSPTPHYPEKNQMSLMTMNELRHPSFNRSKTIEHNILPVGWENKNGRGR